jgi:hypothetical protein
MVNVCLRIGSNCLRLHRLVANIYFMGQSPRDRVTYEKQRALELHDSFSDESLKKLAKHIGADADLLINNLACSPTDVETLLTRPRVQLEDWLKTWGPDARIKE